ncbi:DoxX family protein, partial [Candidatus Woesearchaeota archaeon]|nr:DoxX family protein [Candidatus Woesearchaeota archaeon]
MNINQWIEKHSDHFYAIFRIGVGALFFMFGIQKLFGLWGMPGGAAIAWTLIWFAGIFELMIGTALIFGVLTRLASFFGAVMMAIAYYLGHVMTGGWNPTVNMGMPALVFGLAFLATFAYGARTASVEQKVFGK